MPTTPLTDVDLGGRVRQARLLAGLTQGQMAASLDIPRTALTKVESGARRLSSRELVAAAEATKLPIDWFTAESGQNVVSRRAAGSSPTASRSMDVALEVAARDVEWAIRRGLPRQPPELHIRLVTRDDAAAAATAVRNFLGAGDEPLNGLLDLFETMGFIGFSRALGDGADDGAMIRLEDGTGVALINADQDPGRRRFTLAHELGHFIADDAFSDDRRGGPSGQRESTMSAFAAHLLMPRSGVVRLWAQENQPARLRAVRVAGRFGVSWSACTGHLVTLGLIDRTAKDSLDRALPSRLEHLQTGHVLVRELEAPSAPRRWLDWILTSYFNHQLSAPKAVELGYGILDESELPERADPPTSAVFKLR